MGRKRDRPGGGIRWHQLFADDLERSAEFYSDLLGWTLHEVEWGLGRTLILFERGAEVMGGMAAGREAKDGMRGWIPYFSCFDIEPVLQRAQREEVRIQPDLAGLELGRFARLRLPTGDWAGVCRLTQPERMVGREDKRQVLQAAWPEPTEAGRFIWNVLETQTPLNSALMLCHILGWTLQRVGAAQGTRRFLRLRLGERDMAGVVMGRVSGFSGWIPYARVVDVGLLLQQGKKLGATVVTPPTLWPGVAEYAVLRDPCGTRFGVVRLGGT